MRSPNNMLTDPTCPFCKKEKNKNNDILKRKNHVLEEFNKRVDASEYKLDLSNFENLRTKIKIYYFKCKNYFYTDMHSMISGKNKCSYCIKSYPEKIIENYLKENNFNFETQKTFYDCKDKKNLKFDFYLNDLNTLIEYDGEFHYKNIKGADALETCKLHDKIKNDFAYKNNINLVRIPYWEKDNIIEILNNQLNAQRLS